MFKAPKIARTDESRSELTQNSTYLFYIIRIEYAREVLHARAVAVIDLRTIIHELRTTQVATTGFVLFP